MKAYVRTVILPGERTVITGRLHWIIYHASIFLFLGGTAILVPYLVYFPNAWPLWIGSRLLYGLAIVAFSRSWFTWWCTEFAVTNLRVVYKKGFITRHTVEMNLNQVVTVRVDQSVLGRILGYGTLHVFGAGQSIEHLHNIASPLRIRTAIIANEGGSAERLHLGAVPVQ